MNIPVSTGRGEGGGGVKKICWKLGKHPGYEHCYVSSSHCL